MIHVIYEPEQFRLCIIGHSNAAPKGEDLVCAAVSALGWTLLWEVLAHRAYHAEYRLDEKQGLMDICCAPGFFAGLRCRRLLRVFVGGLELIAGRYPEYVKVETRSTGHGD